MKSINRKINLHTFTSICILLFSILMFNTSCQNKSDIAENLNTIKEDFIIHKQSFQDTLELVVQSYQEALNKQTQQRTRSIGKIDVDLLNLDAQEILKTKYYIDLNQTNVANQYNAIRPKSVTADSTISLSDYAESYFEYFGNTLFGDEFFDSTPEDLPVDEITALMNEKYLELEEKIQNDSKLSIDEKNILLIRFETQRQMQGIVNTILDTNNTQTVTKGWFSKLWKKLVCWTKAIISTVQICKPIYNGASGIYAQAGVIIGCTAYAVVNIVNTCY